MDYGLPKPSQPESRAREVAVPLTVRWHPGCLGLAISQLVGALGCLVLYLFMEAENAPGWSGLETLIRGVLLIGAFTIASFVVAVLWGIKSRRDHRRFG